MPLPPKNPSAPDPFKTPRAADRGDDDSSSGTSKANDGKTTGGKSSEADTLKSLPSSGRDGSSSKSAPDSDDRTSTAAERASSPVETRSSKKRERSGDISKRIPRKYRYNFEDELSRGDSEDSSDQIANVLKVANEEPLTVLSLPVSHCSGPSLPRNGWGFGAQHNDSTENAARGLQAPALFSAALHQFGSTASGVISFTKRNSKKPGSSTGKPIVPGSALSARSETASKVSESGPRWAWAGT